MKATIVRKITSAKSLMVMVVLGLVASSAMATVIFDDNFNGTAGSSLNAAYWVASANTLNGDGTANISTATLEALSSVNTGPTATEVVRATYQVSAAQWNMGFDLTGGIPGTGIVLRNDGGDSQWYINIDGQGAGLGFGTGFYKPWNWSGDTIYTVQLDWYASKVVASVAQNGGVIYDSSVDTPSWTIPTNARHPNAWAYGAYQMDQVVFETFSVVPEPSSAALLVLGGLMLLRRGRKLVRV